MPCKAHKIIFTGGCFSRVKYCTPFAPSQLPSPRTSQGSHVSGQIDLGAISSLPSPLGRGQEFYTGSRYPTSLIVERALSSKTHFMETRFCLTRAINEAQVNNLDIFFKNRVCNLQVNNPAGGGKFMSVFSFGGALPPVPTQLRASHRDRKSFKNFVIVSSEVSRQKASHIHGRAWNLSFVSFKSQAVSLLFGFEYWTFLFVC